MMNKFKHVITFTLILWGMATFASSQNPDYIIYGKDTIATYNLILEKHIQAQEIKNKEKQEFLHGLSFRKNATFNCWRGYQAIYKIEHGSLFLVDIINCGELSNGKINKKQSSEKMKDLFGDKVKDGKVFIDWYDGYLNFPLTSKTLRSDGIFYKIYEKEKVISVLNGHVIKTEDFDNYIDDPKRIDRRDENKLNDFLYNKLQEATSKNKDASNIARITTFEVIIDENGSVSKVISPTKNNAEVDPKKDIRDIYIARVFNALKDLKFDIIKDKGKPISEKIRMNIYFDANGKVITEKMLLSQVNEQKLQIEIL